MIRSKILGKKLNKAFWWVGSNYYQNKKRQRPGIMDQLMFIFVSLTNADEAALACHYINATIVLVHSLLKDYFS
jgi:hypothetical protein